MNKVDYLVIAGWGILLLIGYCIANYPGWMHVRGYLDASVNVSKSPNLNRAFSYILYLLVVSIITMIGIIIAVGSYMTFSISGYSAAGIFMIITGIMYVMFMMRLKSYAENKRKK